MTKVYTCSMCGAEHRWKADDLGAPGSCAGCGARGNGFVRWWNTVGRSIAADSARGKAVNPRDMEHALR